MQAVRKTATPVVATGSIGPQLQRKCACGGTPGRTGECAECRRKRMRLQRCARPGNTENQWAPRRQAVAKANDAFEREADRVAESVLRSSGSQQPAACPTCEGAGSRPGRQRREVRQGSGVSSAPVPGGRPLPRAERAFFEPRFGYDFSRVRVHNDGPAADSARSLDARAYTFGASIVFGSSQYSSRTAEGKLLLAHELTHVIQQGAARKIPHGGKERVPLAGAEQAPALRRAPACGNEAEVEAILKRNPRGYDLTAVTMSKEEVIKGDNFTKIAKRTKGANKVTNTNDLAKELVKLNKGILLGQGNVSPSSTVL